MMPGRGPHGRLAVRCQVRRAIHDVPVTVENFTRAESDRMFASFAADAGGVNRLKHG